MEDETLLGIEPNPRQGDNQLPALTELDRRQIDIVMQSAAGGAKNVQDIYPLSPLQEGMLFHHLLNEHNDTYVLSTLFELESETLIANLVDALQKVMRRHDVLRTAVLWERLASPLQIVQRDATLPVQRVVLKSHPAAMEQFKERMKPGQQRLKLQEAPLMRLHVAADTHSSKWYALLQLHHLICDYRSWNLVVDEAMAYVQGRGQELPAPVPYRNQVAWMLTRNSTQEAEAFFRRKLAGITGPTVPFGVAEAHGHNGELEETSRELDSVLAQQIRTHLRRSKTSAARLFHAAWALVVAHTSNQDDVVFGTVLLTSQLRARAERLLGLSVNTLPLRLRLHDVTAGELLEQTHAELADLLKHEQAPLPLAQRCSGLEGTASLFTALLNYRRATPYAEPPAGLGIRVVARGEAWTNYPLALTVDDFGESFLLTAQTDRRISARRLIDQVSKALKSLVDALEHAPQTPALLLSIVPDWEWHQVVRSFNATGQPYPREKPIHRLFEEQVENTPTAMAAMHGGRSLTYEQLNSKANQLARHLRKHGVRPDQVVGIFLERGLEMVIGLLGILKAGAAYLPLDPSYPAERLQYMLEDAAPPLILTQDKLKGLLPATDVEPLIFETTLAALDSYSASNLSTAEVSLSSRSLVYVIYTSGSTGRPKGTEMPHSSMANLIEWHRQQLPLRASERVLQFAALSFDVAFQEIFSTLCNGGTLVLLNEWMRTDARALLELLNNARIDRLFVPPVMLQSLAEYSRMAGIRPTTLRDVIVAGEQLRVSEKLVDFFKAQTACRLHNHYGPTETHVVTAFTLEGDPTQWPTLPPIGHPIPNVQIFVLDGRRQPVSSGVVGEVYIAGANTARGYLNRPELTAERFVTNPFDADPHARMYKTGDLGRWREDGVIEYLGRNDDQVKIRGFRVELGEVEAQLARHEQVKEAAVVAREDIAGEKRLVAYVTLRCASGASVDELNAYLKPLLPDHMIPSAFVVLNTLPLTPSGKLNRLALPAPAAEAYASRQYEPPQGEVESALAAIWSDLLGVGRIGRHDHFFKLGGNSISTLRVVVRVLEEFSVHLTAVSVFRYPLLKEMAQVIEISTSEERQSTPTAGQPQLASGTID